MSDLIITPVTITAINPHPNADRLEICRVGGWDIISGKGNYNVGDVVVHIPPDAMVPRRFADEWGVTQYLSFKKEAELDSSTPGGRGRVRAARLRGVVSFGFLVPNDTQALPGADLTDVYDIRKYEPPPPPVGMSAGQMASQNPLFHTYTDIQNLRNFPDKLVCGEPLVVTEKIHGTNSRVGWIKRQDDMLCGINMINHFEAWRDAEYELVVGTHRTQRKIEDCGVYGTPIAQYREALNKLFFWAHYIHTYPEVGEPISLNSIIVFGEIYGQGVQDLHYGAKQEKGYRVFDISINGEYMNWRAMDYVCRMVGLPTVPLISSGVFTYEDLLEMAQGSSTLDTHIREGIVVRPMTQELTWGRGTMDPQPKRMIFKVISDDYMTRKEGTEYH